MAERALGKKASFLKVFAESIGLAKFSELQSKIGRYNASKPPHAKRHSLRPVMKHPLHRSHFGQFTPLKPL